MKRIISSVLMCYSATLFSQTPCENGSASGYPCNQITLQSHISVAELQGTQANDIWGWTDPISGKEYALIGLSDGVTFVDITSPTSPIVIGKLIETHNHVRSEELLHGESAWRDIKVYSDHAYVVSDLNEEHGMQIFDLTQLRNFDGSEIQTFTETARYTGIGSAHNIVINEESGFGYIVGISSGSGSCAGGGLHILDLLSPADPQYVACFDDDGYTHDAQCVIYNGSDADYEGMEICFNSNEDTFTIVNTNSKSNIEMISRTGYTDAGYTHQGWLSEDHNYFFMNDEFDEGNHGYNPRTIIWDVRDLDNPIHIGAFYNEEISIDHNLYTHDGLIFESNYSSGLRVLDYGRVADAQLREVAYFDTQPQSNVIAYQGSWSNYPYFESGNIIISDMANGLFVVKLAMNDEIIEHPKNVSGCENSIHSFYVETNDTDLSFQWQMLNGTNFVNLSDGGNISGSNTPTLSIGLVEGVVRAKVENANGSVYYSYPAEMILTGALPEANFSFTMDENTISFESTIENSESFLWDFGDGNTSLEANPIHTYEEYGEYVVSLVATNGCGEKKVERGISYLLSTRTENVKIYPNPVSTIINIEGVTLSPFSIHTLSGQLVSKGNITSNANTIDTSNLSAGTYILSFKVNDEVLFKRITKK